MNKRTFALSLLAATGLTFAAMPSALAASPQPPAPMMINGEAVVAAESGCSDYTCIEGFKTVANVVYVHAKKRPGAPSNCEAAPYHFHIWGPNINTNTELKHYCHDWTNYDTASPGKICAEGWSHVPGGLQSRGLPCINL